MKKAFLIILSFFCLFECFSQNINIGLLNGPTSIPSAYLMKDEFSDYNFEIFSDPSQLLSKMIKKEIDIGFLPANVAAKAYNSTKKNIVLLAVTGNGNLSLITKDKSIKKLSDLKGKTVYVAGQGATVEYMFSYILEQNGIIKNNSKGVVLDFSIPNAQIAPMLINNKISYAIVPEPFVTIAKIKSKDVLAPINLQSEYEALEGEGRTYPLSVMVVRKDFAEKNKELIEKFLNDYEQAVEWTINYPSLSGRLCEKYNIGLDNKVVTKSIPNANYVFIPATESKKSVEDLLSLFLKFNPDSIGGKLPDEWFYYEGDKFFEK